MLSGRISERGAGLVGVGGWQGGRGYERGSGGRVRKGHKGSDDR